MKLLIFAFLFFSCTLYAQSDFEKGEKLFRQKKLTEAKVLLDNAVKMNSKNYEAIELLGDIAGQQKKWDDALSQYRILRDNFPSNANFQYKFGGALGMKAKDANKFKALGMLDEVEGSFLKAAKLDPKHIESRWALVIYYLEIPGILGGSEKKSQKYANELMAISQVDGYLADGHIAEYFKRYEIAEKYFIKAHEIGKSPKTFQRLYDLYIKKLKNPEKAKNLKEQFEK